MMQDKINEFMESVKGIKWFGNHGDIDPSWRIFDTWNEAAFEIGYRPVDAMYDEADQAFGEDGRLRALARDLRLKHWDAELAAYMMLRALSADDSVDTQEHIAYAKARWAIWEAGYIPVTDVNGVFYVAKQL